MPASRGQVILISEEDHLVNDLGIKGLGELGNVGTNAAVANAVYHATGVRIRRTADPAGEASGVSAAAKHQSEGRAAQ